MIEMLDIVDATDRVIDQASRGEVHRRGCFHRAVHIVLCNSLGQVFVQLRSATKDNNPNLWDTSAAGHVDAGESYLDCAVRELDEELGVQVTATELRECARYRPAVENGNEFVRVYIATSDTKLVLQAEEVAAGRWLSPAELDRWIDEYHSDFTAVFLTIWHNARDHL